MSAYNERRGPNMSQYIANLNSIEDFTVDPMDLDTTAMDNAFDIFTGTEFFDFDAGALVSATNSPPLEYDAEREERARRQNATAYHKHNGKLIDDGNNQKPQALNVVTSDFQFDDYSNLQNGLHDASMASMTTSPTSHYPIATMSPVTSNSSSASSSVTYGGKRKVDPLSDPSSAQALEEATRLAAEEDKRRRNTAASARFRVKKKQREQLLEKQAKDNADKVSNLEKRVNQLETENKWLKGLITEKNENRSDITELYKRFTMDGSEPRSTRGNTDGVGTDAKDANASKA